VRDSKPSGLLTNVYHADLFLLLCSQLKGGWEHWPGPPAKKYLPDRGRQRGATYPLPRVPPKLVKRKAARSRRIEAQAVLPASKGGAGECALDVEGMGFEKAENGLPLEASCTLALWRAFVGADRRVKCP